MIYGETAWIEGLEQPFLDTISMHYKKQLCTYGEQLFDRFLNNKKSIVLATTYSSARNAGSTIGLSKLNFSVRDGMRCTLASIITKTMPFYSIELYSKRVLSTQIIS